MSLSSLLTDDTSTSAIFGNFQLARLGLNTSLSFRSTTSQVDIAPDEMTTDEANEGIPGEDDDNSANISFSAALEDQRNRSSGTDSTISLFCLVILLALL